MSDIQLILHIGAGKTGTSSIQKTFQHNIDFLKKQGYWYLGLLLENEESRQYSWQNSLQNKEFHTLPKEELTKQVIETFEKIIDKAKRDNIHTLIWSNESFFNRNENLHQVLTHLLKMGIKLKIIAYVREYAAWTDSAYLQWGIKHKTYRGNIQPFDLWVKNHTPYFYRSLKKVSDRFPDQTHVRNMVYGKDIVKDFCSFCEIDIKGLSIKRSNTSLSNEELLLRLIFNRYNQDRVLPNKFNQIIPKNLIFKQTPISYLQTLLPPEDSMKLIKQNSTEDRDSLNDLLISQNQEPIENKNMPFKTLNIDAEILLMSLYEIVIKQSIKLHNLENILLKNNIKVN